MDATNDLNTIFQALKDLLSPYAPPLVPKMDDASHYDLWSIKDLVIEGRKRKEVYFAGLIIQKGYVGFYFMPVYAETDLKAVFAPGAAQAAEGQVVLPHQEADSGAARPGRVRLADRLRGVPGARVGVARRKDPLLKRDIFANLAT